MRVFVTGASGWIGSAVVPELLAAGHSVLGLARTDASAAKLAGAGAEVLRGELKDLDALRAAAGACDGVIHLAFVHDFSRFEESIAIDRRAIETLGSALEASGKPLVVTGGTPAVPGRMATEGDTADPGSPVAGRDANCAAALGYAQRGVRASAVRLPRVVHGEGDRTGFIPRLIATARNNGVSGFVGDGSNRWPAVHVADAARLYLQALEQAPAGSMLHAVGEPGVPLIEIAEIIGARLALPVAARPAADFGFLGPLLSIDQPASGEYTEELLGWQPVQVGLIEDLDKDHYFAE
jgi:nucleoside-diphosphate-sugar epimerase